MKDVAYSYQDSEELKTSLAGKQALFQDLKKQLLLNGGVKHAATAEETVMGRMREAFPNKQFPFAALHEFFCFNPAEEAASAAFISTLLSARLQKGGPAIWISTTPAIFPPALKWFGIQPHQVLFLRVKKQSDVLCAIDEVLKCASLSAVVAETPELCMKTSRRFQLTIETSGVGCFLLRNRPRNLLTTAVSRWHIKPLSSLVEEGFPGIGHPRWQVKLLKARNGQPQSWDVAWSGGRFKQVSRIAVMEADRQKQTG